jgi:hypothetical protein
MILLDVNLGPFAPLVGIIGSIIASVCAIIILWVKRFSLWRVPDEDLPGTLKSVISVICGAGIVVLWVFADPSKIQFLFSICLYLGIATLVSYLIYSFLISVFTYYEEVKVGVDSVEKKNIMGGLWLTQKAKEKKESDNKEIQELLKDAAYVKDKIWSRMSRAFLKVILQILFITIIVGGTITITSVGLAVQVKLSDQPASNITNESDVPGLNEKGD